MFDFSDALEMIKDGHKMRRNAWEPHMFVFLVPGSEFAVSRPPLLGIYPEGTIINYRSHIDICDEYGKISPYTPSQTDMFETDWKSVTS